MARPDNRVVRHGGGGGSQNERPGVGSRRVEVPIGAHRVVDR